MLGPARNSTQARPSKTARAPDKAAPDRNHDCMHLGHCASVGGRMFDPAVAAAALHSHYWIDH